MINFENAYVTVFNPNRNDRGIAMAGLSSGRKVVDKTTEAVSYVNSSWGNAVFLGDASKNFDTLQNMDRIIIKKGRIERVKGLDRDGNEIKDANGRAVFYLNLVVFDFEKQGGNNSNTAADNSDTEQDLPF